MLELLVILITVGGPALAIWYIVENFEKDLKLPLRKVVPYAFLVSGAAVFLTIVFPSLLAEMEELKRFKIVITVSIPLAVLYICAVVRFKYIKDTGLIPFGILAVFFSVSVAKFADFLIYHNKFVLASTVSSVIGSLLFLISVIQYVTYKSKLRKFIVDYKVKLSSKIVWRYIMMITVIYFTVCIPASIILNKNVINDFMPLYSFLLMIYFYIYNVRFSNKRLIGNIRKKSKTVSRSLKVLETYKNKSLPYKKYNKIRRKVNKILIRGKTTSFTIAFKEDHAVKSLMYLFYALSEKSLTEKYDEHKKIFKNQCGIYTLKEADQNTTSETCAEMVKKTIVILQEKSKEYKQNENIIKENILSEHTIEEKNHVQKQNENVFKLLEMIKHEDVDDKTYMLKIRHKLKYSLNVKDLSIYRINYNIREELALFENKKIVYVYDKTKMTGHLVYSFRKYSVLNLNSTDCLLMLGWHDKKDYSVDIRCKKEEAEYVTDFIKNNVSFV